MLIFRSLRSKLTTALLFIMGLVGIAVTWLTLYTTDLYHQEVSQKLNRQVAEHIINQAAFIKDGRINYYAVEEHFHNLMIFNPSLEIYLLDNNGSILAFSASPWKIKRQNVAIGPIKRYLTEPGAKLVKGDDPRDFYRQKIFSASALHIPNEFDGYLYVIVGGEEYDDILQKVRSSHVLSLSVLSILVGMVFSFICAIALFTGITYRLKALTKTMLAFQQQEEFDLSNLPKPRKKGDEIDQLTRTFQQMAEKIQSQLKTLKAMDSQRREMVANVSHDLRTPLATLQGYIETLLLKDGQLTDAERKQYLEIAIKHCTRLNKLVVELFELAKLDSESMSLHAESFNILELVQDIVIKFQLNAEQQQISISVQADKQLPFVYADLGLIERVLENLLENAIKHTPQGGSIEVGLSAEPSGVSINITDNGSGIPETELPYVFQRFYQLDKTRSQNTASCGLGLAIVKRIMELHKTDIEVKSHPGEYTSFIFQLQQARIHNDVF